jgi:hypothetical protein
LNGVTSAGIEPRSFIHALLFSGKCGPVFQSRRTLVPRAALAKFVSCGQADHD